MGAWGPGIFADDDTEDLRADYRNYLGDTQSDVGATDAVARDYGASFDRLADTTAFWLALALIQWKLGRLDPRVKDAALKIIDEGFDLAKWDGSPDQPKRAAALRKARETIASPPPPAKPLPKPLPVHLPGWEFSEIAGYRMSNNKLVLLHVLNYHAWSIFAVKAPVVTILNWFEDVMPNEEQVGSLTYINHNGSFGGHHLHCLAMPRRAPLREEQFIRFGWKKPVTRGEATSAIYGFRPEEGRTLDTELNKVLHLYWEDPTRPVHLPKEFPGNEASRALYEQLKERMFGTTSTK